MKICISVISLLTFSDFVRYSICGIWPTFETLIARAKDIGADGVQVLILKGWRAEELIASNDICSIESSWEGKLGKMLFAQNSQKIIERVILSRKLYTYKDIPIVDVITTDGKWAEHSLIEVSGCPKRADIMCDAMNGKKLDHGLVYDTHHAREILEGGTYAEWMLPIYHVLLGREPLKGKLYQKDAIFRSHYNEALASQIDILAPHIELIQIQTRSKHEASSILKIDGGKPSILEEQLLLLEESFACGAIKKDGMNIVLEIPPWWGWLDSSFKKRCVTNLRKRFS